jgi:hypothetical protein
MFQGRISNPESNLVKFRRLNRRRFGPRTRYSWHETIDMKLDASLMIRDHIDKLHRSESRRVFASLVRLLKDFDVADYAMHKACATVEIWQRDGAPANPRAWLISTGKFRKAIFHSATVRNLVSDRNFCCEVSG